MMILGKTDITVASCPPPLWRFSPIVCFGALSFVAMTIYAAALLQLGATTEGVATVVAVGLAALLSGIAGFAFSAICGAMLFQFRHDTVGVVEIMLVCSLVNQTMNVWLLRRDVRLRPLAPLLIGGVLGVPAGVWLLLHLDVHSFCLALGILLVAYGGMMLVRRPTTLQRVIRGGDTAAGFIGGMIGGFAATPGAVAAIWFGMKDWDKVRQRAAVQPFILCMQVVALIAIPLLHGHGAAADAIPSITWACVPAGLFGTCWGIALFKRMTDRQFAKAVNLLLIVSGIGLFA